MNVAILIVNTLTGSTRGNMEQAKKSPEEKRREEDQALILDPDQWPNWPILPIKRRVEGESWPELAFINGIGANEPKLMVIFENMHRYSEMTNEQRKACRIEVYDGVNSLLDDGWMVD